MSEQHTPGAWWINGEKSVRGPNGEYIARCNWKNGTSNARLIAASPTMYEYLRKRAEDGDVEAKAIMESINA